MQVFFCVPIQRKGEVFFPFPLRPPPLILNSLWELTPILDRGMLHYLIKPYDAHDNRSRGRAGNRIDSNDDRLPEPPQDEWQDVELRI